ncbi:MAG: hypothetical protein CVU64_04705 [Deltaproteobacteria bacterium HGW-Deltaproteobacteria-21]|nr:MAG: hypothetical protein CVU64_04705 [Deltaproteobacteria bacterium HGW-Deltaproteobacteria-21]
MKTKRIFLFLLITMAMALFQSPALALAQERPQVGGFEQIPPGQHDDSAIGAGWGHRSMTYGMMNLMSGMTSQVASILRSGKATPEMMGKLSQILDHIAGMLNYAPAYMMGTKTVDSNMMTEMQQMLMDLEKMRKEIGAR